jgi:hypothetical protein
MTKKRNLVQIPEHLQQKVSDREAQAIQAFTNECAQVQGRRCEMFGILLGHHVATKGIAGTSREDVARAQELATYAVELDCKQKWETLRDLFAEHKYEGPQPHLEWASKQVGVRLFPEEPMVKPAQVLAVDEKVIQ